MTRQQSFAGPLRALRCWIKLRERSQARKLSFYGRLFDIVIRQAHHSNACAMARRRALAAGRVTPAERTSCEQGYFRGFLAAASLKHDILDPPFGGPYVLPR